MHDLAVLLDLVALVQVQRATQVLELHDVGQLRLSEPQQAERAHRRRTTEPQRHHLQSDVRASGQFQQVRQLFRNTTGPPTWWCSTASPTATHSRGACG